MARSRVMFIVIAIFLAGELTFAQNLGTPSLGWVTVTGGPAGDSGFVDVGVNSYQVEYKYSPGDTADSVLTNLEAGFNSSASPVTASIAGSILVLTSKTPGSGSNSSSLFAFSFGNSFSTRTVGMIGGRDGPRNFRMVAYGAGSTDTDIPFPSFFPAFIFGQANQALPLGHSIIDVYSSDPTEAGLLAWWDPAGGVASTKFAHGWSSLIQLNNWDVTRIDAVNVDEPYGQLFGHYKYDTSDQTNPCDPNDPRYSNLKLAHDQLGLAAAAIKQSSPRIRFWVNFSGAEVAWMLKYPSCAFLNAPYIDVVSLDYYRVDFNNVIRPYYDWLRSNPGYIGQQVAFVPGTFVGHGSDPASQAGDLEEFLDYAAQLNQSCTLPLGSNVVTGAYDGCPVWLVAGWTYTTTSDNGGTYIGLSDPVAGAVQAAWGTELLNPAVDHGVPAIQIFALQSVLN